MSIKNCLFCKILNQEIPANILYQDDHVVAFDDIHPQAPIHKLIIPTQHIASLNELTEAETLLMGRLLQTAKRLAKQLNIDERGYRTVINCQAEAGQEVFHLHVHLLGGRPMHWPPG